MFLFEPKIFENFSDPKYQGSNSGPKDEFPECNGNKFK
jgi:hypothetical protein